MVSYKTTLRLFGLLTFIILASLANAEKEKNIYLPEEMLLKFNGKPYVRIYQAIYKEQDKIREAIDKNEYPILTKTDKKKMIKKGVNKPQLFKDIYQDENGRIIIFPNSHLNAKLYFGIADYCNELKYMHTYTTPRENTNKKKVDVNPFIKSFIVPYEIVYDILKRVKAEKENNDDDNSNACDLKYANQFGFKRSDVDLLREYTLPNTLVTFMENTSPLKGQHLGLIKHINIIPDKNAITPKFLPQHCKLTALGRILEDKMKESVPKRKKIDNELEDVLKEPYELEMEKIPEVKEGSMETGITKEMIKKSKKYRAQWSSAKNLLGKLETFVPKMLKYKESKINHIKRYNSADKILGKLYYEGEDDDEQKGGDKMVTMETKESENKNKKSQKVKEEETGMRMKLQIEGGFLDGLPEEFKDAKHINEVLSYMTLALVDKVMENKKFVDDAEKIAGKIMEEAIKDHARNSAINENYFLRRLLQILAPNLA